MKQSSKVLLANLCHLRNLFGRAAATSLAQVKKGSQKVLHSKLFGKRTRKRSNYKKILLANLFRLRSFLGRAAGKHHCVKDTFTLTVPVSPCVT